MGGGTYTFIVKGSGYSEFLPADIEFREYTCIDVIAFIFDQLFFYPPAIECGLFGAFFLLYFFYLALSEEHLFCVLKKKNYWIRKKSLIL